VVDALVAALPPEGPALVTLVGSSQVREGLDCAAFEAASPERPCRNLAISAGTPLDALYIQSRLGNRPRHTLFALFPKLLHMGPKAPFVDATSWRVALESGAPWSLGTATWGPLAYGLLQQVSPTLRAKDASWALWGSVRNDLAGHWRLSAPAVPDRLLAGEERKPEQFFRNRTGVLDADIRFGPFTRLQHEALLLFLERERAAGRRPVVVDFPTHPDYETTLPPDVVADYRALLARLSVRPDLRFVGRGELPPLSREDFLDFTHVGPRGRDLLSSRLAAILALESPSAR
jgi:hypothetical protein